ncbi:MAG: hypothetical protein WD449_00180 [Candidatus Babeliales bacterium]
MPMRWSGNAPGATKSAGSPSDATNAMQNFAKNASLINVSKAFPDVENVKHY